MELVFVLVGFVLFLLFVALYWRQVVNRGFMRYFRAGELITEGYLPPFWVAAIERRLWWQRVLPWRRRQAPTGTDLAVVKLDEVATFLLDHSGFLEPAAKKLLFDQLKAARSEWQTLPWDELRQKTPPITKP
jgi:hypothetical protein